MFFFKRLSGHGVVHNSQQYLWHQPCHSWVNSPFPKTNYTSPLQIKNMQQKNRVCDQLWIQGGQKDKEKLQNHWTDFYIEPLVRQQTWTCCRRPADLTTGDCMKEIYHFLCRLREGREHTHLYTSCYISSIDHAPQHFHTSNACSWSNETLLKLDKASDISYSITPQPIHPLPPFFLWKLNKCMETVWMRRMAISDKKCC